MSSTRSIESAVSTMSSHGVSPLCESRSSSATRVVDVPGAIGEAPTAGPPLRWHLSTASVSGLFWWRGPFLPLLQKNPVLQRSISGRSVSSRAPSLTASSILLPSFDGSLKPAPVEKSPAPVSEPAPSFSAITFSPHVAAAVIDHALALKPRAELRYLECTPTPETRRLKRFWKTCL